MVYESKWYTKSKFGIEKVVYGGIRWYTSVYHLKSILYKGFSPVVHEDNEILYTLYY